MSKDKQLGLKVLGTTFTVHWGARITPEQRADMQSAWSRCAVGLTNSALSSEPNDCALPTDSLPFTALITYDSKLPDGGRRHLAAPSFERLAESLTSELTLAAILEQAGELTMLHSCGVADLQTGTVVALVAKSGTGKTTASSVLAKTRGYVTDETVAIRPDGSVIPYPKPLSVKQPVEGAAKSQVGPDELGLAEAPHGLRLGAIVLLDRSSEAQRKTPSLQQVPLADAVLALIPDSSSQAKIRRPLQSLCQLIESVGGVWRVQYTEAEDLVSALEPLFSTGTANSTDWSGPSEDTEVADPAPPGCYVRIKPVDAVEIDDELILLLGTEVVRLGGIAPLIWELAGRPVNMQEIVRGLEVHHGLPDGHQAQIDSALEAMVNRGILSVNAGG